MTIPIVELPSMRQGVSLVQAVTDWVALRGGMFDEADDISGGVWDDLGDIFVDGRDAAGLVADAGRELRLRVRSPAVAHAALVPLDPPQIKVIGYDRANVPMELPLVGGGLGANTIYPSAADLVAGDWAYGLAELSYQLLGAQYVAIMVTSGGTWNSVLGDNAQNPGGKLCSIQGKVTT